MYNENLPLRRVVWIEAFKRMPSGATGPLPPDGTVGDLRARVAAATHRAEGCRLTPIDLSAIEVDARSG